jgi:hypothetical protein
MCNRQSVWTFLITCFFADEETIEQFLFGDKLAMVHNDTKKVVGEYQTCVQLMSPDNVINEATVFIELLCNCEVGGMPSGISYASRLSLKRLQVYEENRRYNIEVSTCMRQLYIQRFE